MYYYINAIPNGFFIEPTSNACEYTDKVNETETIETIADTDDVTVSEVMTFDEMVADYAKTSDISYEQALKEFSPCICRSRSNDTYRKLGVTIKVTNSYKPTLFFYCETSEYGQYWGKIRSPIPRCNERAPSRPFCASS